MVVYIINKWFRLTGVLELQKQHFKQELEYLGGQLREESIRCGNMGILTIILTIVVFFINHIISAMFTFSSPSSFLITRPGATAWRSR